MIFYNFSMRLEKEPITFMYTYVELFTKKLEEKDYEISSMLVFLNSQDL